MAIQKETIIQTALTLLNDLGLEGLTMRKLAQALKIQAPSLYHHFASKQALMDGLADALMQEVARKPMRAAAWDARLRQVASEIRRALLRYRDGARVFAGTYSVTENVLRVGDVMIGALLDAGAPTRLASWGAFSVLYYVLGFVMEEQALGPENGVDMKERRTAFLQMASRAFPHAHEAAADIFNRNLDQRFTLGLELLVLGLEQKMKLGGL